MISRERINYPPEQDILYGRIKLTVLPATSKVRQDKEKEDKAALYERLLEEMQRQTKGL